MRYRELIENNIEVREDVALSAFTTFRLGGKCPYLITCRTPEEVEITVRCLSEEQTDFILIGEGSNIVVSDHGVGCVVVRFLNKKSFIRRVENDLMVTGATCLDHLAEYAAQNGLDGLICANGIPGTVGGAIVGNAGAFGQQISDHLIDTLLIDRSGKKREAAASELQFDYRHSVLKSTGDLVLEARFKLKPGNRNALLEKRQEILRLRLEKHPDYQVLPCAGSVFRNMDAISTAYHRQAAGWFLEQAGAKNFRCGGAAVFHKHANIIVNTGNCTAQNVYELSLKMQKAVKDKFHIDLVREVRFVGKFDGAQNPSLMW